MVAPYSRLRLLTLFQLLVVVFLFSPFTYRSFTRFCLSTLFLRFNYCYGHRVFASCRLLSSCKFSLSLRLYLESRDSLIALSFMGMSCRLFFFLRPWSFSYKRDILDMVMMMISYLCVIIFSCYIKGTKESSHQSISMMQILKNQWGHYKIIRILLKRRKIYMLDGNYSVSFNLPYIIF